MTHRCWLLSNIVRQRSEGDRRHSARCWVSVKSLEESHVDLVGGSRTGLSRCDAADRQAVLVVVPDRGPAAGRGWHPGRRLSRGVLSSGGDHARVAPDRQRHSDVREGASPAWAETHSGSVRLRIAPDPKGAPKTHRTFASGKRRNMGNGRHPHVSMTTCLGDLHRRSEPEFRIRYLMLSRREGCHCKRQFSKLTPGHYGNSLVWRREIAILNHPASRSSSPGSRHPSLVSACRKQ